MQFGYIATTSQSELWSKSDPILLLGSWCRPGLEKYKPRQYSELPSIWENDYSLAESGDYCWEVFRGFVPRLGNALNRLHGVQRSERYWEILLSFWFLRYINVLYDRYLLMKSAVKIAKVPWTTVVSRERYVIPSTSRAAAIAYHNDDQQNLQLFSEVARFLRLSVFESSGTGNTENRLPSHSPTPWFAVTNLQAALKGIVLEAVIYLLEGGRSITGRKGDGLLLSLNYQRSSRDLLVLSVLSGATPYIARLDKHHDQVFQPSFESRRQLSDYLTDYNPSNEFEGLLLDSMPYFVPTDLVEAYGQLAAESDTRFGQSTRNLVFDSPAFSVSSCFSEYAARCAESGRLLVSVQHGGAGYGHAAGSPGETVEIELCDRFVSYGWKDHRLPDKTIPLPSLHLSSLKRSSKCRDSILYISFFGKRYLHELITVPQTSQWDDYLDYGETFLKTLSPGGLAKVKFRPFYLRSYQYPALMASLIDGPQCEDRPASRALSDCRLAVIDHASTSWLEAFTLDVPTILFWNPAHWLFRPSAQPFIDQLHKAGILYYDPISAARKIEEIYPDVDGWWYQDDVQRARSEFCKRYAWATPNWRRYWSKALQKLSSL